VIVIAGESLGLLVDRMAPPDTLTDDLDALDGFYPRLFPAAQPDTVQVGEGGGVIIDALANDLAPYGQLDPGTVRIFRQPEHGSIVSIDPETGAIHYQQDAAGAAADSFAYVVFDSNGAVSDVTEVRVERSTTGVDPESTSEVDAFLRVTGAHPSTGATALSFAVQESGPAHLDIFDTAGRLVRRIFDQEVRGGETYSASWDGRNASGRSAATGVYYARLSSSRGEMTVRLARLR
jgi:hypothetical protein